jgi:molybdopterin biosynthesis enzyme MoaB
MDIILFAAQSLFNLGIELKLIKVIPDEESTIIHTIQELSKNYNFVFTSGGIGMYPFQRERLKSFLPVASSAR